MKISKQKGKFFNVNFLMDSFHNLKNLLSPKPFKLKRFTTQGPILQKASAMVSMTFFQ